jgi:hypothetical protein
MAKRWRQSDIEDCFGGEPCRKARKEVEHGSSDSDDEEDIPTTRPEIISASRRTDVMPLLFSRYLPAMRDGRIEWSNPFRPTQRRWVSLAPASRPDGNVLCMAWWSKNYDTFITAWDSPQWHDLLASYPAHYFNFTINSENHDLEPGVPTTLEQRIRQLQWLAGKFGPRAVLWRFDPICFYKGGAPCKRSFFSDMTREMFGEDARDNLGDFEALCFAAANCGIEEVAVAHMRLDKKVPGQYMRAGLQPLVPDEAQRKRIIAQMVDVASEHGITVKVCSSEDLVGVHGMEHTDASAQAVQCVGGENVQWALEHPSKDYLNLALRGGLRLGSDTFKKDTGQRKVCKCCKTTDIGSYHQACPHRCVYCYANPAK